MDDEELEFMVQAGFKPPLWRQFLDDIIWPLVVLIICVTLAWSWLAGAW
jgi:hypothetical protein